ncbi:MAG: hypothetical protein GWP14_02000 [Actinobacteria bacterium]|nr:hypothetical protein [Actinomycetota bacterium]
MAKAYSTDLRLRVLADYDNGVRLVNLADRYRVSERWLYKLLRQRKETRCIEPRRGRTGPKPKLAAHENRLRELIDAVPDATLEELKQKLGLGVSITTLWRALRDLGVTLKKSAPRGRASSLLACGDSGTGPEKVCFSR